MAFSIKNLWRADSSTQSFAASNKKTFAADIVMGDPSKSSSTPTTPNTTSVTDRKIYRTPDEWQREVWDFLDSVGEFRQGINWKANMLSRVRLRAAKVIPGQDEPEIVNIGPANDLITELAGGIGGQSELLSAFVTYLDVPGECYLVGETDPNTKTNKWYLRSIEELMPTKTKGANGQPVDGFKISEGNGRWRELPFDSFVVRVYRAHRRWHNVADSPAKSARTLLRELELLNRHIQAQYLSRLASCGIVVFPDEITFPIRAEFQDAADPFMEEWMAIATESIATPGSAASIVPIPMRVPAEYIDKVQHIDFTLRLDDTLIQKRDSALTRLAIQLDMPPEALIGIGEINHWNAWLIDEQGVKIHVAPEAELICSALTDVYLVPRLKSMGEDPTAWVVWYDASELILRPDRSNAASTVYGQMELSGAALRRENGFDESDKPSEKELSQIGLKAIIKQAPNAFAALSELTGVTVETISPAPTGNGNEPDGDEPDDNGMTTDKKAPDESDSENQPVSTKADASELTEALVYQSTLMHAMKIAFDGSYGVLHPFDCKKHLYSCPVTHATWNHKLNVRPGMSGIYELRLNHVGDVIIGSRIPQLDTARMIESSRGTSKNSKELVKTETGELNGNY